MPMAAGGEVYYLNRAVLSWSSAAPPRFRPSCQVFVLCLRRDVWGLVTTNVSAVLLLLLLRIASHSDPSSIVIVHSLPSA